MIYTASTKAFPGQYNEWRLEIEMDLLNKVGLRPCLFIFEEI